MDNCCFLRRSALGSVFCPSRWRDKSSSSVHNILWCHNIYDGHLSPLGCCSRQCHVWDWTSRLQGRACHYRDINITIRTYFYLLLLLILYSVNCTVHGPWSDFSGKSINQTSQTWYLFSYLLIPLIVGLYRKIIILKSTLTTEWYSHSKYIMDLFSPRLKLFVLSSCFCWNMTQKTPPTKTFDVLTNSLNNCVDASCSQLLISSSKQLFSVYENVYPCIMM